MKNTLAHQLSRYVPEGTEKLCAFWLKAGKIQLKVATPRKSKLGDFRSAHQGRPHRISVNNNLEPLQFLITFTHEVAHAHNWDRYGTRVKPHGAEWKKAYGRLLQDIIALNVLDAKTADILYKHSRNPKASSVRDSHLQNLLPPAAGLRLNDLAPGSTFKTPSGRVFRSIHKLRKYWLCEECSSGHHYRVLGTVSVNKQLETV